MQKYISDLPEIKETVYDDFSQLTPYDDDYSQVAEEQYSWVSPANTLQTIT